MDIAIRPTIVPRDYAAIAAVLQAESPEWGATAEELAHDDAGRDPRYYWAVLVAEAAAGDTPLMVGVAFIGQDTLAQRDGAFEIKGLPSGNYLAVAVEYLEEGQDRDPEFLRQMRSYATSVQLVTPSARCC